jgi:hypothetical protein
MIAAKYRLFSAEPKASKFPRYADTEEVAALGIRVEPERDNSPPSSGRSVAGSLRFVVKRLESCTRTADWYSSFDPKYLSLCSHWL